MGTNTTKVRIQIISDTHGQALSLEQQCDVLLHCGDLTMDGRIEEFQTTIQMINQSSAELKLVIPGNHDISLDERYYERMGKRMHGEHFSKTLPRRARDMWLATPGIKYLEEGIYSFILKSGAIFTIYASPFQPEFCDWAFQYPRDHDRFNHPKYTTKYSQSIATTPIPRFPSIDIVMTHGPPMGHLDQTPNGGFNGSRHLQRAAARTKPRIFCFGHIHEGYGAEIVTWSGVIANWDTDENVKSQTKVDALAGVIDISETGIRPLVFGEQTLMVNASILDGGYQARNKPWIIDLDLPVLP